MNYEHLLEDGETIISHIIQHNIKKREENIKTLNDEANSFKLKIEIEGVHPLIYDRLNWHRLTLYEYLIDKLKQEIIIYKESFSEELIEDIEYELYDAKLVKNLDHKHEESISSELLYLYENIVTARVNIISFQNSSLGENDYTKDVEAINKKISDVQEFTFVDTSFKYPELPHVTIQKLVFNLCDEKKSRFLSTSFVPVNKKTIQIIGKLLSGKKRASKEQKKLIQKERRKFQLQEKFKHL